MSLPQSVCMLISSRIINHYKSERKSKILFIWRDHTWYKRES